MSKMNRIPVLVTMMIVAAGMTAGVTASFILSQEGTQKNDAMPAFESYNDLSNFMDKALSQYPGNNSAYFGGPSSGADRQELAPDYSQTNVRVQGVDEADIVKTDGKYIYAAHWNSIAIIKAYPPSDMKVLSYINESKITDNKSESIWISGIYISGESLFVISSVYYDYQYYFDGNDGIGPAVKNSTVVASISSQNIWHQVDDRTVVSIFDVSDPTNPTLANSFAMSGNPVTSRMAGDYLYSISQLHIWKNGDGSYVLPMVMDGLSSTSIDVSDIHYDPETKDAGYYLNILAIDLQNMESNFISIVSGWASTIYMSPENLFLTYEKWPEYNVPVGVMRTMSEDNNYTTTIYRIHVDKLSMKFAARGEVNGFLLNQFAIDEKDGYLRLATTTGWINPENAVYILDDELNIVGSLEGLAPSERIYSARFVVDTLYLVTFRQIDPLFVIDLSNPTKPTLLGEVKVAGLSTYLHPMDDTHILGIGAENGTVKLSIFDISDPEYPKETEKYLVDNYSYTISEYEYKSILFDLEKGLLVIPMNTYGYEGIYRNWTYWSGVYIFDISISDGISLKGMISHGESHPVERSLYIGDYLYTISSTQVNVNLLGDLSFVNSVNYWSWPNYAIIE